jgi:hypothetical protein
METKYRIVKKINDEIEYLEYMDIKYTFFMGIKKTKWLKIPKAYMNVDYYSSLRGDRIELKNKTINSSNTTINDFVEKYKNIEDYLILYIKEQKEFHDKWTHRQNKLNNELNRSIIESNINYFKSYKRAKIRIEQARQEAEPKV